MRAKQHAHNATVLEQALVDAVSYRYSTREVPAGSAPSIGAHADAMRRVNPAHGEKSLDIAALTIDALMKTALWKLYQARNGEPDLATPVLEVRKILESALGNPDARYYPSILHLCIHLTEMFKCSEVALKANHCLRNLVPDGGHIHHMSSHIDVLVGNYRRAMHTSLKPTYADEKYLAREEAQNLSSCYRLQNHHSLIYAAMVAGNKYHALDAISRIESTITKELLRMKSPPMADWLKPLNTVRVYVHVRFGTW
jgi:hypothetical protein